MNQPQILVIDDELGIREGCKGALAPHGYFVETAENGVEGCRKIEAGSFDLALIDVMMPGTSGIDLSGIIHQYDPEIVCIIITGYATVELAVRAIKQGAYDFLTKPFQEGELFDRVCAAMEHYRARREHHLELQQLQARLDACTPRELEVMRLLARGLSNKGIAETLGISPRTVEIHRAHLMERMEADSLPALVRMITLLDENGSG